MSKNSFKFEDMIKQGFCEVEPGVWNKPPSKPSKSLVPTQKQQIGASKPGIYTFYITPMGKPSFAKSDRWRTKNHFNPKMRQRPNVGRWIEFKKELAKQAKKQEFVMPASKSTILFILPMPDSWSNKKKALMDGQPHQSKPDADNCCKGFFDSVCPDDDSYIWEYLVAKRWGQNGKIIITI